MFRSSLIPTVINLFLGRGVPLPSFSRVADTPMYTMTGILSKGDYTLRTMTIRTWLILPVTVLLSVLVLVLVQSWLHAQVSSILQQQQERQDQQLLQESLDELVLLSLIDETVLTWIELYIQEEWMRNFREQYPLLLENIATSDAVWWRVLWTVLTNYLQIKYPLLEQYHEERETESEKQTEEELNPDVSSVLQRKITVQQLDTVESDWYEYGNARIDQSLVRAARQSRINTLRAWRSLASIEFDPRLHLTAQDRSEAMNNKWTADHKRFSTSAYYDYRQLVDRFGEYWIEFENVQRATFTENVGYATMRCDQGDCTDDAIESLRYVYEYFRSEEWQAYDAHRRTMIHPLFTVMGVGISVDEQLGRIYITIHYGTDIID